MKLKTSLLAVILLLTEQVQADSDSIKKQIAALEIADFKTEFCNEASKYQTKILQARFIEKMPKHEALSSIRPFKAERFNDSDDSMKNASLAHIKIIDKTYMAPDLDYMNKEEIWNTIQTSSNVIRKTCMQKLGVA